MKTTNEVSIYDLGGEHHYVWVGPGRTEPFEIVIENDEGEKFENELTFAAAESLAEFCRRYLSLYDRAQFQRAELNNHQT